MFGDSSKHKSIRKLVDSSVNFKILIPLIPGLTFDRLKLEIEVFARVNHHNQSVLKELIFQGKNVRYNFE